MKLVLLVAVSLLAGCQDRSRERAWSQGSGSGSQSAPSAAPSPAPPSLTPPAPAGSGSAAATPPSPAAPMPPGTPGTSLLSDFCRTGLTAIEQAKCPTPQDQLKLANAKQAISGIVETMSKVAGADPRQFQVMCAQMLLAIERDAAKLHCAIALDAGQRKELNDTVEAWYAQRTPVTPTGDAPSDAFIARIVAVRDAACACKDAACLERVDQQLGTIGSLPPTAPDAARTLTGKLIDDATRCATRIRSFYDGAAPPAGK